MLADSLALESTEDELEDELELELVALELEGELDEVVELEAALELELELELEEVELVFEEWAVEVDPVLVELWLDEDAKVVVEDVPPVDVADESELVPGETADSPVSLEAQAPTRPALSKPRATVARARR